ncbi:phosphoenolpyruvate carboxykinase (GTP) [Verrucomicrobiota bacterium]
MDKKYKNVLTGKLDKDSMAKLDALDNEKLHAFVADAVTLCDPASVLVFDDSKEDIESVRKKAIDLCEETPLSMAGHTVHFDAFRNSKEHDQARDKENTRYLVPKDIKLGKRLNSVDRDEGLVEIRKTMKGIMAGKEAFVRLFCLGPTSSPFSIPCVQITDSAYVSHSEDLLYRAGYEEFKRIGNSPDFFRVLHSAGRLENNVSADLDKRRIYIDILEDIVYSANTQYAGNTVGLKKLSLRLAIRKADREGWLAEHMFIMGVRGPGGRVTYFTGAYPSACGKTSTAMLPGELIVGDDLAYFRVIDNEIRTVNVEKGIFGIIENVNPEDDPEIYKALTSPAEIIFSNILVTDGRPYWIGMGSELPEKGLNYSGEWQKGKTDSHGKPVTPSYEGNARYTIALAELGNTNSRLDDPNGVPVGGFIYGGRDSDTSVPIQESFDWSHGIITMAASLESETTKATIGEAGVRTLSPMANMDFVAIPLGKYIQNNLDFGKKVPNTPLVFSTNYWLKDKDGNFLNGKLDKGVWMKWMDLRVHGEAEAIDTPTGRIPLYEDLVRLFKQVLDKDYPKEQYVEQFTTRVAETLAKMDRAEAFYSAVTDAPKIVFETLRAQRERLEHLQASKGKYVSPLDLA